MNTSTDSDWTTLDQANMRDGHYHRPEWLVEAERAAQQAQKWRNEMVDAYLEGRAPIDAMLDAERQARAAHDYAADMRYYYQAGIVPAGVIFEQRVPSEF